MPLKLAVRDRQTLAEYLGTVDVGGGQGVGFATPKLRLAKRAVFPYHTATRGMHS
jgi:hypothetical protein